MARVVSALERVPAPHRAGDRNRCMMGFFEKRERNEEAELIIRRFRNLRLHPVRERVEDPDSFRLRTISPTGLLPRFAELSNSLRLSFSVRL